MMRPLLAAILAWLGTAAAQADFKVMARHIIGGEGGYDYVRVDPVARRVYVAHEKRFEVLDADSGRKIGEIGGVTRAHGVAIATGFGHGFATSGIDDLIVMFDLQSLATLRTFKSPGSNPDAIEYDPDTQRIFVGNHGGGGITVLDPRSGDVIGNVPIEGKLEGLAFDNRGRGFVNLEDRSAVGVFDTHTLVSSAVWSAAPGEGGTGLVCDAVHHRLFSACANRKVIVLDSDSGRVIATPTAGEDPDGLAFDPQRGFLFTSNPDGTMSVLHQDSPDRYSPVTVVPTAVGAKTIGFDAATGRVFTCAPQFGPRPPPVKGGTRPRAPILPGTFALIVVGAQ